MDCSWSCIFRTFSGDAFAKQHIQGRHYAVSGADDHDILRNSDWRGICSGGLERLACDYSSLGCYFRANPMVVLKRCVARDNLQSGGVGSI